MSTQKSPFVEARPVRPQRTESGEGALETSGLEESCALALGYRVWAQEWVTKRVRGNIQFQQRSEVYGGPMHGLPPGVEMGASWIKALGPRKSGPAENLSLLAVADWEAVKGEKTEAWAENCWILSHWRGHCSGKSCLPLGFE